MGIASKNPLRLRIKGFLLFVTRLIVVALEVRVCFHPLLFCDEVVAPFPPHFRSGHLLACSVCHAPGIRWRLHRKKECSWIGRDPRGCCSRQQRPSHSTRLARAFGNTGKYHYASIHIPLSHHGCSCVSRYGFFGFRFCCRQLCRYGHLSRCCVCSCGCGRFHAQCRCLWRGRGFWCRLLLVCGACVRDARRGACSGVRLHGRYGAQPDL